MTTLSTVPRWSERAHEPRAARFAVAWQHPTDRGIFPVGLLDVTPEAYTFRYLDRVREAAGFTPFIGFPDLGRTYSSIRLFPFFEQRMMDPRRADFPEYVAALGLSESATEIDLMARSSGNRIGDTVRLSLEPVVGDDGICQYTFPVHGVRHVSERERAEGILSELTAGEPLSLRAEPENPVNSRALQVVTRDGEVALGWVPDLLLEFVHLLRSCGPLVTTVLHANQRDQPSHLSLFVRIEGSGPAGHRGFSNREWATIAGDESTYFGDR